ncbi:hypothetical protein SAMN02745221_00250 [Thermosyntropha lipolytica DSM 11003]|uniref:Uncharacterized protein n=1 Tax=Thermosyntropha lipolytica DSM 11003 TaxID=1123382 RepID=A0A1M5JWD1_9FIRM|nr:hypothetical protein [Thermosyntropha lipolytica]SHG44902.1 hypothetical protein SAMN02745221_00250 [Thermosyntropha lipolytica DSM 11003]
MSYKSWFFSTLALVMLSLLAVAGFNWYIDPHWCFGPSHRYNQVQMPFDERAQKTNYVKFHPFAYDALLLGSSRVTYINPYDFSGLKVYNYGVNNMLPEEYYDYIEYAKKKRGKEFDYIIIGLDFWTTNQNKELPSPIKEPAFYIKQAESFGYRYKMLFSYDTYKLSRKNYLAAARSYPVDYFYDRRLVKHLRRLSEEERKAKIENAVAVYRDRLYRDYTYVSYAETFRQLKRANPHTRFIVFTTPESLPLLELIEEQNLTPYYQQWLRENVEVFGEVYHFSYPNSVTTSLANYYDASHFYPHVGAWIAERLLGREKRGLPDDFGVKLTRDNIDQVLKKQALR